MWEIGMKTVKKGGEKLGQGEAEMEKEAHTEREGGRQRARQMWEIQWTNIVIDNKNKFTNPMFIETEQIVENQSRFPMKNTWKIITTPKRTIDKDTQTKMGGRQFACIPLSSQSTPSPFPHTHLYLFIYFKFHSHHRNTSSRIENQIIRRQQISTYSEKLFICFFFVLFCCGDVRNVYWRRGRLICGYLSYIIVVVAKATPSSPLSTQSPANKLQIINISFFFIPPFSCVLFSEYLTKVCIQIDCS